LQYPGILAIRDALKSVDPTIKVGTGWYRDNGIFDALQNRQTYLDFIDWHANYSSDSNGSTDLEKHYFGINKATHIMDYYAEKISIINSKSYLAGKMEVISSENDAGSDALKKALHHGLANSVSLTEMIKSGVKLQSQTPFTSTVNNPFGIVLRNQFYEFTDDYSQWHVSAPSWPYQLYAKRLGSHRVNSFIDQNPQIAISTHTFDSLYVVAGKDSTGSTLDIIVTNVDGTNDITASLNLQNFIPQGSAAVHEYNGATVSTVNTLINPTQVGITVKPNITNFFSYTFPAHSVTAIRLTGNTQTSPNTVKIDNTSPSVAYVGSGWSEVTNVNDYIGNVARSQTLGNKAQLTFTGTSIKVVARKGTDSGFANIYLDGNLVAANVDTYASPVQYQQTIYENNALSAGSHTISLEPTGTKNASSSSSYVKLDNFEYTPVPVIVDNTSSSVTYVGSGWSDVANVNDYTGNVARSQTLGNKAQLTFTGTSIKVVARKGTDSGFANIYLDGNLVAANVDTYASPVQYQQTIYENNVLSVGSHTISLEPTGTKNVSSSSSYVKLDYFEYK
jgi:hypothetical protein